MSYISEALKKAEAEKLGKATIIPEEPDASAINRESGRKRRNLLIVTAVILLVVAGIFSYRSLFLPEKKVPINHERDMTNMYRLALEAQKAGDLAKAEDHYRKIIAIKPDHLEALNNLGVIYMLRGQNHEAKALFLRVLTLNNRHALGYYNLSCLLAKEGEPKEAIENLKKAINIDSNARLWAKMDRDFISIREEKEFQKLVGI